MIDINSFPLDTQIMLMCLLTITIVVLLIGIITLLSPSTYYTRHDDDVEWDDPDDYTGAER